MAVAGEQGVFWDDLTGDLEDPEFARLYAIESVRISTIDAVVNSLDEARLAAGMSKAELARAIGSEPATIRRLFTAGQVNPTLGTLAQVAAALGFEIVIQPAAPQSDRQWSPVRHRGDGVSAERGKSTRTKRPTPMAAKARPERSTQGRSR